METFPYEESVLHTMIIKIAFRITRIITCIIVTRYTSHVSLIMIIFWSIAIATAKNFHVALLIMLYKVDEILKCDHGEVILRYKATREKFLCINLWELSSST